MIRFARQIALTFMLTLLYVGILPSHSLAAIEGDYLSLEIQVDGDKFTPGADNDSPDDSVPVSLLTPATANSHVDIYPSFHQYSNCCQLNYQSRAPPALTH